MKCLLFTIVDMFWATCAVGEFRQKAVTAFDATVDACNCREVILIFKSCLLKPTHTYTNTRINNAEFGQTLSVITLWGIPSLSL